jgi:hypothetical protein
MITALLLAASMLQGMTELSGTAWKETTASSSAVEKECPIRFEFERAKYRYINTCTGAGRNKVVEYGEYVRRSDSIVLNNRRVVAGAGSIFGDDPRAIELKLVESETADFAFEYDGVVVLLRKAD